MKQYSLKMISDERSAVMGFAILMIIFFHSSVSFKQFSFINTIKSFGNIGVDIFLFLSGMGLFFSAEKQENKGWKEFYIRRFVRIIPATIICLTPWYLYISSYSLEPKSICRFILDITSLSYWIDGQNRGWYISLTIVLYLIYPAIYLVITNVKKWRWVACFSLVIIDITLNTIIALLFSEWFNQVNLALCRVPIFVIGCFFAPQIKEEKKCNNLVWISAIIVIVLLVILFNYKEELKIFGLWRYFYAIIAVSFIIVLSYIFSLINKTRIRAIFSFFGRFTLELYLTHTQVLTVLSENSKNKLSNIVINALSIIISFMLSVIIHSAIDRIVKIIKSKKM